jgi:hypothetical protein
VKQIAGEIVIGAPRSAKRYEHAPSMCVKCWLDCPQPILNMTVAREIRVMEKPSTLCYVCEQAGACYPVDRWDVQE